MAKIKKKKKYLGYEFSSGSYTGEDYKSFQTKYINYLKAVCRNNHWQLVNVGRNHYCFSAFIKSAENKCVYISIPDVRYFPNEWYLMSFFSFIFLPFNGRHAVRIIVPIIAACCGLGFTVIINSCVL